MLHKRPLYHMRLHNERYTGILFNLLLFVAEFLIPLAIKEYDIYFIGGFGIVAWVNVKEYKSLQPNEIAINVVNVSDEQQVSVDIVVPSACDTNHVVQNEGGSLLDKPQSLSSKLSQSAKDMIEVTKGTINENAPLTTMNNDRMDLQSVQVSSTNLHKDSLVSPQTPSSDANEAVAKGNYVPKPRRRSAAREIAKKDTPLKEKTPRRCGRAVDKSPAGRVMRIE
ncbi:hypothetical protein Tco_0151449 [Tanacetum coccineum]